MEVAAFLRAGVLDGIGQVHGRPGETVVRGGGRAGGPGEDHFFLASGRVHERQVHVAVHIDADDGDRLESAVRAGVIIRFVPDHALTGFVAVVEDDLARRGVVPVARHGVSLNGDQDGAAGVDLAHVVLEREIAAVAVDPEGAGDLAVHLVAAGLHVQVQPVRHGGVLVGDGACVDAVSVSPVAVILREEVFKRAVGHGGGEVAVAAPVLPGAEVVGDAVPAVGPDVRPGSAVREGVFELLFGRGRDIVALIEPVHVA